MKRFCLLVVALLLLWVDVLVLSDRKYPAYEVDELYGRKTQDFVMGEIVGEYMPIDVVSDVSRIKAQVVEGASTLTCRSPAVSSSTKPGCL